MLLNCAGAPTPGGIGNGVRRADGSDPPISIAIIVGPGGCERKKRSVDLADVVDATDVAVGDLAGDAHLAAESLQQARIERRGLGQELQRDLLLQFQVVCSVDLAHAAAAEKAEDAIPLTEDDADGKTAVSANVGRPGVGDVEGSRSSDVRARWGRRGHHCAGGKIGAALPAEAALDGNVGAALRSA